MADKSAVQRYVEGNASEEEIRLVVDWLDADDANVREFMALHKLHDIAVLNKSETEQTNFEVKSKKYYRKIAFECLKIAAIVLFCWVGTRFVDQKGSPVPPSVDYYTLFVPAGQRAEMLLPDSTKVWLNANTRLVYPSDFGGRNRLVKLDGEAYFDVKRKEEKPFIVRLEKLDIEVLGTEFNVNSYSGHINSHIALLKGEIAIKSPYSSLIYTMKRNEQAQLENGKLKVSKINDYDYFKWKDGLLCFNNEPVTSIIEKLQLVFDVTIDVNRTDLLAFYYTGKFRTKDGVEQVLKVLQLEHHFTYERNNELNLITIQ